MKVVASSRQLQGSSASRRLRHAAKVPGILYGGNQEPSMIELDHNPLYHALRVEAFHASILEMELDGKPERVLLRNVQWHPYKPVIQHIDFQRVAADQKIVLKVPLHFTNQEASPAVKLSAAIISHVITEISVSCLPADLPEFVAVDLSNLQVGQTIHMRDLVLPAGVKAMLGGRENPVLITVSVPPSAAEETPAASAPAAKKGEKKK
ncbi:MAG: 50S ribosomal protein L25/general stress protein Ctc [Burkholderiales bacterium]|nr:50S ribosomal protein L25/general stress protein Ctc [Burkholderiales bacterium]